MNLRDRDDDDLITLALGGDPDAYGALVERYRGAVHGMVYAVVGPVAEVEDLAQETFLRAYLNLGQLREAAAFAPWLRRVGVSVCLNWVEAHRPERLRAVRDIVDLDERDLLDPGKGPEELVADK